MKTNNNNAAQQRRVTLEVFTVNERETEEGKKSWWTRVGSAFVNRDGSINVKLDALPVNGTLQIREPDQKEEKPAAPRAGSAWGGR